MTEYAEWMRAMWGWYCTPIPRQNPPQCEHCQDTGIKALMCCNGYHCGCQGLPYDFVECGCGAVPPAWFTEGRVPPSTA